MMGKSHIVSGVGVAGIVFGGCRYLSRHYVLAGQVLTRVSDNLKLFFFPADRHIVLRVLMLGVCVVVYMAGLLGPDMDNQKSTAVRRKALSST